MSSTPAAGAGRPGSRRSAAAFAIAAVGSWALVANLHRIGAVVFLAGVALLVALLAIFLPARAPQARFSRREILAGSLLAAALGLFFRLRYLRVVPIGYGSEPLNFVTFAQKLIDQHFPYAPYSWYAHTLYSYFIAVTMWIVHPPLFAFRVTAAVLSLATLAVFYLCVRVFQDARAAWIGTGLMAISYWHVFATRDGLHQFLLPLFQLLFLYGLGRGLMEKRAGGFVLAAAAMALGLHAYWGFYLVPPLGLALLAYLWAFDRALLRRSWKAMALAAALTVLLLVPLAIFYGRHTNVFEYVLRGFSPETSFRGDLRSKILTNLQFLLWTLSGNPEARIHAEYAPVLDLFVSSLALLGLVVSLRRFTVSLSHAVPVLLLAVNVAGLAVTLAGHYYVVATLAAVFWLAAIGVHALVAQWQALGRTSAATTVLLVAVLAGWRAQSNYEEFFGKRIFTDMPSPAQDNGAFYTILDRVLDASKSSRVYLPRREPERDFQTSPFQLGKMLPDYQALAQTAPFSANTILFPSAELGGARGVEIFLPSGPFAEQLALPQLQRLYPSLQQRVVFAPDPYRAEIPRPVAYEASLPFSDVRRYQGLRDIPDPNGRPSADGLFFAPEEGRYDFRSLDEKEKELKLHGKRIEIGRPGVEPSSTLLEAGLHPLSLAGQDAMRAPAVLWRAGDGEWQPLGPWLVNTSDRDPRLFHPYLARSGRSASFRYVRRATIQTEVPLVEALLGEGGEIAALSDRSLVLYDDQRRKQQEVGFPYSGNFRLAREAGRWQLFEHNGDIYSLAAGHFELSGRAGCPFADLIHDQERVILLCADGRLLATSGDSPAPRPLKSSRLRSLVKPVGLARTSQGFFVLDAQTSEILLYDEKGGLKDHRVLAGLYEGSNLVADREGDLYVDRFEGELHVYSPEGELLFHPKLGSPQLFFDDQSRRLDARWTYRLRLLGDQGVSLDRHERRTICIWKRESAAAH